MTSKSWEIELSLYEFQESCFDHGRTTYFKTSPDVHFAQATQGHHLENWIAANEPMIRSEVNLRSQILSRYQGQTFIDEYFRQCHRMPHPIPLGQAGELQSTTLLDGG
jgi:hypothetical protein